MKFSPLILAGALLALPFSSPAEVPSVSVTFLHPPAASDSSIFSISATEQAGAATIGGTRQAGVWTGTPASFVPLTPPAGATSSTVQSTQGNQRGGSATIANNLHAVLFTPAGGMTPPIDLHPVGATISSVTSVAALQQVGYAFGHAALWSGSAASYLDLNPPGASSSSLYSTTGTQQAGSAYIIAANESHAGIWSGQANTFVDLNPSVPGCGGSSVNSTTGLQQAGYALIPNLEHAAIWANSAASYVDLHPIQTTASASRVSSTDGTHQVGRAVFMGVDHAAIWMGSAASFVDLHASLPANYTNSFAFSVTSNNGTAIAAGRAFNSTLARNEAVLWTVVYPAQPNPLPSPATVRISGGKKRVVHSAQVTVKGRASNATKVTYRISGQRGSHQANGLSKWKIRTKLQSGRNVIHVTATGPGGPAKTAKVIIIRK